MANPYVRGFPKEEPYTKLEIDKDSYTFTLIKMKNGKILIISIVKQDASIASEETKPPKSLISVAYKQAYAIFRKSEERVKKKNKTTTKKRVYIKPHKSVKGAEIGSISKLCKKIFLYSDVKRTLEIGFGTAPEDAVIHGILLDVKDLKGKLFSKSGLEHKVKDKDDGSIELKVAEKYRFKIFPFLEKEKSI